MSEGSETVATPPKTVQVSTVETLHRSYTVVAPDEETAKRRLRAYWSDPDAIAPGIVTRDDAETVASKQIREPATTKKGGRTQ